MQRLLVLCEDYCQLSLTCQCSVLLHALFHVVSLFLELVEIAAACNILFAEELGILCAVIFL